MSDEGVDISTIKLFDVAVEYVSTPKASTYKVYAASKEQAEEIARKLFMDRYNVEQVRIEKVVARSSFPSGLK